MHKRQKCIQTLGTIRKKSLLLKTTKNARYVRSLGKKPHFGAYTEAKKGVAHGHVRSKGSPEARKMQIPPGYQKKNVYCIESLRFCRYGGNFMFERGGVGPLKIGTAEPAGAGGALAPPLLRRMTFYFVLVYVVIRENT